MTDLQLLQLAISQAKEQSANQFSNQVVYMYYSKELTEYTVVPEKNVETLLSGEPNLTLVAKFLNGKSIEIK